MSGRSELRRINNVIHELGHAFNKRLDRVPESAVAAKMGLMQRPAGFYGYPGNMTWVQSPKITGSEIFADQFIGWVYGKWANDDIGNARAELMTNMVEEAQWVSTAASMP
jgi:hypothetical protein